jgi:hypothetical protein
MGYTKQIDTYNDIHGFIKVDDDAVLVYYGDGGYAALREHVNNIEYGSAHRGSRNGVIGVLPWFELPRRRVAFNVSADTEFPKRKMEGLGIPSALRQG